MGRQEVIVALFRVLDILMLDLLSPVAGNQAVEPSRTQSHTLGIHLPSHPLLSYLYASHMLLAKSRCPIQNRKAEMFWLMIPFKMGVYSLLAIAHYQF